MLALLPRVGYDLVRVRVVVRVFLPRHHEVRQLVSGRWRGIWRARGSHEAQHGQDDVALDGCQYCHAQRGKHQEQKRHMDEVFPKLRKDGHH